MVGLMIVGGSTVGGGVPGSKMIGVRGILLGPSFSPCSIKDPDRENPWLKMISFSSRILFPKKIRLTPRKVTLVFVLTIKLA